MVNTFLFATPYHRIRKEVEKFLTTTVRNISLSYSLQDQNFLENYNINFSKECGVSGPLTPSKQLTRIEFAMQSTELYISVNFIYYYILWCSTTGLVLMVHKTFKISSGGSRGDQKITRLR